jgi:hypothetical protein
MPFFKKAGFTTGEGSFLVKITRSPTHKVGKSVKLSFYLTQHVRDEQLMKNLVQYFGCGSYITRSAASQAGEFICTKFGDIYDILIIFKSNFIREI